MGRGGNWNNIASSVRQLDFVRASAWPRVSLSRYSNPGIPDPARGCFIGLTWTGGSVVCEVAAPRQRNDSDVLPISGRHRWTNTTIWPCRRH